MASVDGSSLLAAAIRAAILAKAPRRTVQAIAAAVTSVLVHQIADACPKTKDADHVRSSNASNAKLSGVSAEEHVEALRAARSARRRRKRANKRARSLDAEAAASAAVAEGPVTSSGFEAPTINTVRDVATASESYGPASITPGSASSRAPPAAAQTAHADGASENSTTAREQASVGSTSPGRVQRGVVVTFVG